MAEKHARRAGMAGKASWMRYNAEAHVAEDQVTGKKLPPAGVLWHHAAAAGSARGIPDLPGALHSLAA